MSIQNYALISGGAVRNVIVADADFIGSIAPEWDHIEALDTLHEQGLGIGWGWDGENFIAPVQPEPAPAAAPDTCTPAQGLVALYVLKGITEDDIKAAIDAIPDPATRYTATIGLSRATEWRRDSDTMQQMAALLSLGESDLDALYTYAVTVAV